MQNELTNTSNKDANINNISLPTNTITQFDIGSYNIIDYILDHPQSENKPVIHNINWDALPDISNTDIATTVAKYIFKPKVYWKNKSFLYDSV